MAADVPLFAWFAARAGLEPGTVAADTRPVTPVYVAIALAAALVIWSIWTNNRLIAARNKVDEAWSGIDVQLKRRHDLVPNLVATVKGYAAHEHDTLLKATEARAAAMAASDPGTVGKAENALSGALSDIRVVAEQYPDLRASENFQKLQSELAEVEDEIQAARRIYNSNVQQYNTRQQVFPNSVIAGIAEHRPRELFAIEVSAERLVPTVAFG